MEERQKKKSQGTCEGSGWATRLRKRKKKDLRVTCEGTGTEGYSTLWKRGKKGRLERCVRVLGGLYIRLRKSGRKRMDV